MAQVLLSASEILLFLASLYGWGSLVNHWTGGCGQSSWAYLSALGIAVLIAIGGVLNAAGIAVPAVLLALLLAGVGMAAFFIFRSVREHRQKRPEPGLPAGRPWGDIAGNLIYYTLLLLVFFFLIKTLMPARSFNFHDDFHVYFMWPVMMLQTGSLGGNPFDHIGMSSLGAQAFVQGMFLALNGTIADINAFDAVLCLVLSLGLLKELGERLEVHIVFILTAGLLVLIINPHYVNVTSLYSGTLMLLGLAYATLLLTKTLDSSDSTGIIPAAVVCSLFLAALLALKTTYVFTLPLFWAASLTGSLLLLRGRTQVLWAHGAVAAGTVVLLLSWVAVHLDRYLPLVTRYLQKTHFMNDIPQTKAIDSSVFTAEGWRSGAVLLSNAELFYGNTGRDYLFVIIMLCFALAAAVWFCWRRISRMDINRLIPMLAVLLSVILTYAAYIIMTNFSDRLLVRYPLPLLLAAAPVAVLLSGWLWKEGIKNWREKTGGFSPLVLGSLLLTFQIAIIGMFGKTFLERVKRANSYNSLVSFPLVYNSGYINYNQYVLSAEAGKRISHIQNRIPAGESILAWVSMPMHLDYRRNRIFPTFEHGISNRLLVMPLAEGQAGMRDFFRQLGIRYFIWEYEGYGMKQSYQYGGLQRKFIQTLTEFLPSSRILYNHGGIIVFDLGPADRTNGDNG